MGGLAFKQKYEIESKRLNNDDFINLSNFVRSVLSSYFFDIHAVRHYILKESHGDKDIIVSRLKNNKDNNWRKSLQKDLGASHFIQNSSVNSYLINGFQVDIDLVDENNFDTHTFYSDFDPSGNLIGKLYHKFNIQYGGDGLFYVLRDLNNTYKLGKIQISKDNKKICEFLGLDYYIKAHGDFYTQENIFEWIASSKYFDARIFAFENMNHIARTRDRKRPSYNNFMNYIQDNYNNIEYSWPLKKEAWLEQINDYFPESKILNQIKELKDKELYRKSLAAKFNGDLVRKWTGLEGQALGEVIKNFKKYIDSVVYYAMDIDFEMFLDRHSERVIENTFKEWFYKIKNKS